MTDGDSLRPARLSVSIAFVLHAAVAGTWAPRLPTLKAPAGITNGQLGLALFVMAAGLLGGTRSASSLIDRHGSRAVLRVGIPLQCVALTLPGLAHGLVPLSGGFLALGFASGLLDVAMNAHGVEVERRLERPILNRLHGSWCVGLGIGAALAALAASAHLTPAVQFTVVGGLIAGVSVVALGGLLRDRPAAVATRKREAGASSTRWSGVVVVLCAVAFGSFFAEGSVFDWSAIYLREDVGTGAAAAAAGLFAFAVAMAASRFAGDRLALALGPVRLVRFGALAAAAGLGIGLAVSHPVAVIAGFGLFGAGLAPVVPTTFSAAGRLGGPGSARVLGRAVTSGYSGSVLGPLVIGGLSQLTSVRVALALPVVLALVIAASAGSAIRAQAA